MPRNNAWLVFATVLSVLLIVTCILALAAYRRPAASEEPAETEMELRSYEIPAGYEDEVKNVLRSVLHTTDPPAHGRVSMGPGGQLVVLAPASVHLGVESLIEQLPNKAIQGPVTFALDYWMVVGRPSDEPAAAPVPEIAVALAEVSKSQGPMEFELQERLRLLSTEGAHSRMQGAHFAVDQEVSLVGVRIVAMLQVQSVRGASPRTSTEANLEPGQLLVLSQSGYPGTTGGMLLIVIRAQVLSADG